MSTQSHFLGVSKSLSGKAWRQRPTDDRLAAEHARRLNAPDLVGRLLAARGVKADEAELFLNPTLKDLFPDPSSFADMDKAADVILDAIVSGKKVAVFADYDVDGGTSSAILSRYFRAWGRELILYVPDRLTGGLRADAGSVSCAAGDGRGAGRHGGLWRGGDCGAGDRERDRARCGGDGSPPDARRSYAEDAGAGESQPAG